jgi:hypothetical protein
MKTRALIFLASLLQRFARPDVKHRNGLAFAAPMAPASATPQPFPAKITDANIQWKIELPGTGHSSPVLWGEKIFLTSTGDKAGGVSVLCLNAVMAGCFGAMIFR